MKPKKIINQAIQAYLSTGTTKPLRKALKVINKEYKDRLKDEQDYRSGEDTYGYRDVKSTMEYISDRWGCAFRLRWLKDGIENRKF
jgi:hypothetical protein